MAHIQLRIDHADKKAAEAVLKDLGLNFSSAIKLFLKQVVREQKLPFEISVVPSSSAFENKIQASPFSSRKIG